MAAFAPIAGCSQTPKLHTWPVHGVLKQVDGSPVTSGALRFQSDTDQRSIAIAEIAADGTFVVQTLNDRGQQPGAVDGEYRVIYSPPQSDPPLEWPVTLSDTVKIEPAENRITLTLPAKGAKRPAAGKAKR